ncbi:MAG: peptide deformylase [Wenzhouxiangellaceae bacterium]|nr:peptide deformylase [Wenzhouxiangellaceae bacterium]
MTELTILRYPDPRLRTIARPVASVDQSVRQLVDDMFETMYAARGIGLAATQVNQPLRLLVLDLSEARDRPQVFINPEITAREGAQLCEEGCLSVPGEYAEVERAERISVRALDRDGTPFEVEADGLLAVCIQHEIDHLDGKVFVDYLSPLKRRMIEKRMRKTRAQAPVRESVGQRV